MINIYCDESCHLEFTDKNKAKQVSMILGGISCPKEKVKNVSEELRKIKSRHGIWKFNEVKWTKASYNKIEFYKEVIEYFFNNDDLRFRTIVFQDKNKFNYEKYDHNEIYYIMYFYLLREMIDARKINNIYIDKKDTRGGRKIKDLKKCLCNEKLDFDLKLINNMQIINSSDSELMQLVDILIGAVGYANRLYMGEILNSTAKLELVEFIKRKTGYSLLKTTLRQEDKFNIFIWHPMQE
ncbi:hypothetical protein BD780_003780 [Clostridium tetanomorphum]|uniref:DUF3800 domain-containing protein n=1 Tax=Clostridium tetanomorphum TaxID=1553 RepID=A0A923EBU2_CLOTT|nr:DUF3800 domain-containing protein [Clostridium tetanomorphum]KAJ52191.1 hypothetical protein CTM_09016 [Clostridium tetanomorphum DSM 665]MBC2398962.1 DUF3800 domain-containing protein [Clostridium tetanomorphum]MBP1866378.1 hypothetical protein [Clostridium tetanomorphum]NRS86555.1 hypothetical protein [Clostridium tetanomorphum]NRZ95418.1 hypothetical protein [Clostridium tetanomorphum]